MALYTSCSTKADLSTRSIDELGMIRASPLLALHSHLRKLERIGFRESRFDIEGSVRFGFLVGKLLMDNTNGKRRITRIIRR